MILSHTQIENIALAVTHDFAKYMYHDPPERKRRMPRAIPIERFAHEYLWADLLCRHRVHL